MSDRSASPPAPVASVRSNAPFATDRADPRGSRFYLVEIRRSTGQAFCAAVRAVEELEARYFISPDTLCQFFRCATLVPAAPADSAADDLPECALAQAERP